MTEQHNSLLYKLRELDESEDYPYHMPGHKRRRLGQLPEEFLGLDITEIDGFDNLHQPEGILKTAQEQANLLYGAGKTYYMVNGSTGGILSAVSAVLPQGGHILMDRGCHKSAYHAAYLRNLKISYLYPTKVPGFAFSEAVTPDRIEQKLEENPDIGAVLIVSPTYEGRIADIRKIADVVHKRGIPLIVDEAHGAHLGFHKRFAENSCRQGADLIIHSVHKTLPSMTQTALLHLNGELVDPGRVERFLHIYQTSSPSYVLMAGIEDAMRVLQSNGEHLFEEFYENYGRLVQELSECRVLRFVSWTDVEQKHQDVGKLIIDAGNSRVSGRWIYQKLREKYHLQCEMAAGTYCLAMFTIADARDAYDKMKHALLEIDRELYEKAVREKMSRPREENREVCPVYPQAKYRYAVAWDMPSFPEQLHNSAGCAVAEFINLYPPGVPILVPGEIIDDDTIDKILTLLSQGYEVQGIFFKDNQPYLNILK